MLIDLAATADLDVTTADMLPGLLENLHARSIEVLLAQVKGRVRDRLRRTGVMAELGRGSRLPVDRLGGDGLPASVARGGEDGRAEASGRGRSRPRRCRGRFRAIPGRGRLWLCSPDDDPGPAGRPDLPASLAVEGHRRGAGAGQPAGPPGHGLRGAGRAAGDHRPVHVRPVPGRLRGLRAVADPRPRPGLRARLDDRRDGPAARAPPTATRTPPSRTRRCSR